MAGRPVDVRLRASGWLRTLSPLRVGGIGRYADSHLDVALDGLARPYIPGTSLAGACRAWMTGAVDDRRLDHLWGFVEARTDAGTASRVFVRDGLVCEATDEARAFPLVRLEARTSAGVDRVSGAAVPGSAASYAVVPAGVFVRLELVVESAAEQAALDGARLAALLRALRDGEVSLGAASRSGLGRVELIDPVDLVEDDLASKAGLLEVLRGSPRRRRTVDDLDVDPGLTGRSTSRATISWTPLAPVAVRADRAGVALDRVPRTALDQDRELRLVVPGSSVKGALRAHAERILRTVHGAPAAEDVAGRDPLVLAKALFGESQGRRGSRAAPPSRLVEVPVSSDAQSREYSAAAWTATDPDYGAGVVRISDCLSTQTLDQEVWARVATVSEVATTDRVRLTGWGLEVADHVAIDRWTAATADGSLFTVLEPWQVGWQPIVADVDLARLARFAAVDDEFPDWAMALFVLVVRDFAEGRIPVGDGANRGFGDVRATVTLDGPDTDGPVALDRYLASTRGRALAKAWSTFASGSTVASSTAVASGTVAGTKAGTKEVRKGA